MDPIQLRENLFQVQDVYTRTSGQLSFRAVPALADEFTGRCMRVFSAFNRHFTAEEREEFKTKLHAHMTDAYTSSHRSEINVAYETAPNQPMQFTIRSVLRTVGETYDGWTDNQPFGMQADARPAELAAEAVDPGSFRVLDIGAGSGRNALALARRGHPVDAVEMTHRFADKIRAESTRQCVDIRVIESDVFDAGGVLGSDYAMILVSEVVSEFRTVEQLRGLFELAAQRLATGGFLVLNTFISRDGFTPDEAVRQCAQQSFSTIFTPKEIDAAVAGLPLVVVSNDSVWEYEKAHQPAEIWPPIYWYEGWTNGLDVFGPLDGEIPIELRWLVYRKTSSAS